MRNNLRYILILLILCSAVFVFPADSSAPIHKGSIVNGTGGALLDGPAKVKVSGNYAYVASYQSNALEIVDISNPAVPVHKGKLVQWCWGGSIAGSSWSRHFR